MDMQRIVNFVTKVRVYSTKEKQEIYLKEDSARKQSIRLLIEMRSKLVNKDDYRMHVLSAIFGEDILTSNQLDWYKKGALLDALKEEDDEGSIVLKGIEAYVVSKPSHKASEAFTDAAMDDILRDLQKDGGVSDGGHARSADPQVGSSGTSGKYKQLDLSSVQLCD